MITKALIVVDPQNDFCPGGSLAVKDGDQIVPVINKLTTNDMTADNLTVNTITVINPPAKSNGSVYYRDLCGTTFPILKPTTWGVNGIMKIPLDTNVYPTTLGQYSVDFDMPVQAQLRYIGLLTKLFLITFDMDSDTEYGSLYYIAINGVPQLDTTNVTTGLNNSFDRHLTFITPLSTNDYIEAYISPANVGLTHVSTSKQNMFAIEI